MINITIIGAGQIGRRHLQALTLLKRKCIIQVFSPNSESLLLAEQQVREVATDLTIKYYSKLSDLSSPIDVAIIATNSDVRRKVTEELLFNHAVKNIIFEKVLFQKSEDYRYIINLLADKNVKAWVNCPRRAWPFYKGIKEKFKGADILEFHVSGSSWGIGCNSIHLLDLLSYLSDDLNYTLYTDQLDNELIPSKRDGFVEFTGCLSGMFSRGQLFHLCSYRKGNLPVIIQIVADTIRCIIRENEGKIWLSTKKDDWVWCEDAFITPYQSQLTHLVVEEIINTGKCDLTVIKDSVELHKPLINGLMLHLQKQSPGKIINECPIT